MFGIFRCISGILKTDEIIKIQLVDSFLLKNNLEQFLEISYELVGKTESVANVLQAWIKFFVKNDVCLESRQLIKDYFYRIKQLLADRDPAIASLMLILDNEFNKI